MIRIEELILCLINTKDFQGVIDLSARIALHLIDYPCAEEYMHLYIRRGLLSDEKLIELLSALIDYEVRLVSLVSLLYCRHSNQDVYWYYCHYLELSKQWRENDITKLR